MRMKIEILAAFLAAGLSGCGGGGGDDAPAPCRGTMANPDLCLSSAQIASRVALAVYPPSITVGDCTTNIPFVFTGGVAPFTIFTSDNFHAPVSSPLPLGLNSYFMTSVDLSKTGQPISSAPVSFTVTVLDSQSKTATATISVPSVAACPVNPLLQLISASSNARFTEILAFQIINGTGSYTFNLTDSVQPPPATSLIAAVTGSDSKSVNVQALSSAGSTLLTVTDTVTHQKASIVFTVLPAP